MTGPYVYSPEIWPPLAVALFLAILSLFSWRQRSVAGARPFAIACLFATLWLAGVVMEVAAVDASAKFTWIKFQVIWSLPGVTAMTCFALEYVYPGRWLTRRNLILLSIPPILVLLLVFTNDLHHLFWRAFPSDGAVYPVRGAGNWILIAYAFGLVLVNISAFVWLFIRSPQHRWPVALIVFGQIMGRVFYLLDIATTDSAVWPDFFILSFMIPFGIYAIALFGFRIFDPLPAARRAAIEQMRDGMVVLDTDWQILSINAAAESLLDVPAGRVRGKILQEFLPACPDLRTYLARAEPAPAELCLEIGSEVRYFALDLIPLKDYRELVFGYLLLLHDVTGQRAAQAQLLALQWAEATLQEREQLAHELHDGLSQGLAFLNLQAQTAQVYVQTGQAEGARSHLARLIEVARDLQVDVRELIGNLLVVSLPSEGFCSALRQTLARFEGRTGLALTLEIVGDDDGICGTTGLPPATGVQLLRIVQEALTNVRKHAGCPSRIVVQLKVGADQLHLAIEDDGGGFDPTLPGVTGDHFGLQVMRQRAARIDGKMAVHSAPGRGTRVEVQVPLNSLNDRAQGHGLESAHPYGRPPGRTSPHGRPPGRTGPVDERDALT